MATHDTSNWRELFDVALFEPNRIKLRQRIEHARDAINNRVDALMERPKRKRANHFGTYCTPRRTDHAP